MKPPARSLVATKGCSTPLRGNKQIRAGLAVVVVFAALTACGRDEKPGRDTTPSTLPPTTTSTATADETTSTDAPGTSASTAAPTTRRPTTTPKPTTPPATAAPVGPPKANLTRVASLDQPVALATRGGDPHLWIAEKGGRIRVVLGGNVVATPLDISGAISTGSEQGLLGLAIAPAGDRLYVNYTDRSGDTHIVEYTVTGADAIATESRRELFFVDQPFANHNGGWLAFGPDRMLYASLGDGGSGGDPMGNGQRLDTLLGKILRVDPRPSATQPYTVPGDNPFVGSAGARPEIWAFGLRNPWRNSFDRTTGHLWIGDVGQNAWEEVSRAPDGSRGGENYGWNRYEGTHAFRGPPPEAHVPPVHEYPNGGTNCSVTGGYVYRGAEVPSLTSVYVFGDYCTGQLWGLVAEGGALRRVDLGPQVDQLASFGEDAAGELYVLSLAGSLFRIT